MENDEGECGLQGGVRPAALTLGLWRGKGACGSRATQCALCILCAGFLYNYQANAPCKGGVCIDNPD